MKKQLCRLAIIAVIAMVALPSQAQNYVNAQAKGDKAVTFNVNATGTKHSSDLKWGADIAWFEEINLSRSAAFMEDALQVVRTSFQPTADVGSSVGSGSLSDDQKTALDTRIGWLNKYTDKSKIKLVLNCDHPKDENGNSLSHSNYKPGWAMNWSTSTTVVKRWTELIRLSKEYYESEGYTVATIAPLNEPDYDHGYLSTTASYNQSLFKYLAQSLKNRYSGISICGPNVLDPKNAETWFGKITDSYIDEVNTHELGDHYGSSSGFDTWVNFYDKHKSANKVTNDEMHNTFEGMVGLEHGLTTGIWWAPADYVRGEFCKATHGERLAYAEDRTKWTAATVYRAPSGKIQAFGGTSERNGQATGYRFISTERDVFFDGQGPMREYTMSLPGGTAYMTGQTNAEGVVNITYGEDVQPYINGTYALYNKNTNRVLELKNRTTGTGTHITTGTYNIAKDYCQWNVYPVATTVGGGFSYYTIANCAAALYVDCWNSAMESGTEIGVYTANGAPQFWYFDYAGDGWFHIRSGISNLCLATKSDGTICQKTKDASDATQLWRILPIEDASFAVRTVGVVSGVKATAQNASVKIEWTNVGGEMKYSVFKSETSRPAEYELIARDIKGGEFVDNKVVSGKTYYYVVKAVDATLNTSDRSKEVSATPTGVNGAVLEYGFERVLTDVSANKNNAAALNTPEYAEGRASQYSAMQFDGSNFLRLSTAVGSHNAITVAAWANWTGSSTSERIFEFAADENNYFCLTPNSAVICVNGSKTTASITSLTKNTWTHVAVTLDGSSMKLYVGGAQTASQTCTQKPSEFLPYLNVIGTGYSEGAANFNGLIDNFHVYNYAMSQSEINTLMNKAEDTSNKPEVEEEEVIDNTDYPLNYTDKVVNPTFDDGENGWTFNTTDNNTDRDPNKGIHNGGVDHQMGVKFAEIWFNNTEFTGSISQEIDGLDNGTYEFKALAVREAGPHGSNENAVVLFANDKEVPVTQTPPKTYSVITTVTDGKLTIGLKQEEYNWEWMAFNDVELYYYGNIPEDEISTLSLNKQFRELKASIKGVLDDETYSLVGGKERADLDALRDLTVTDKTADGYNAAISTINNGIDAFKNALPQYQFYKQELDNADKLGLDIATEHALYDSPTVTATQLQSNFPALYEKVNAEIDRVYDVDYTSSVAPLLNWETSMGTLSGQHWNGTGDSYLDQGRWNGLTFDYARKTVTLPAGRYAVRGVGRSEGSPVDVRMQTMGQSMRFPINNNSGRGITISGEKSFDETKEYANGGAGRGWQYRNILFELEREQDVDIEFNVLCTGGWWGLSDVELWRVNDVVDLTISDAGYSTLILPFDADVPEGLKAFSCTTTKMENNEEYLILKDSERMTANTPYVIKGPASKYTFKGLGNITQDSYTEGYLTGVYVDVKAPTGSYVLQKNNDKVAFYLVGEGRPIVKANRVYATIPEVSAAKTMLQFIFGDDDNTTGIKSIDEQKGLNAIVDVFTLDGIKVSSGKTFVDALQDLKKGTIYIIDGQKVIIK